MADGEAEDGMADGEAEEDDAALGDPVRSEVNSRIVPSAEEVASGTVGSVCAGSPEGLMTIWSSTASGLSALRSASTTRLL